MKRTLLNVNLERYPKLAQIFSTKDPEQIIQQIEFLPDMENINKDAILFLDEIQAVPEAIPALRFFRQFCQFEINQEIIDSAFKIVSILNFGKNNNDIIRLKFAEK